MNDPYAVLGVSRSATDEELTQAYRKLAKKYHPDMNPGDRSAERRMQEINAAYDQIKNERSGRASPSDSGGAGAYGPGSSRYGGGTGGGGRGGYDPFGDWFGGFGGFGDADWDEDGQEQNGGAYGPGGQNTGGAYGAGNAGNRGRSPKMVQVDLCVRSGYYQQALQILMNIDLAERDSEWFYYSAIANAGIGNRATALRHAQEAASLNPGNAVYAELLNRLERGGYAYRQTGASQGFDTRRFGRSILQCLFSPLFCICCCPRCLYFC